VRFLTPVQTGFMSHPASCTMGTRSVSRHEVGRVWHWPPPPTYLLCGPLWPVTKWILPLPY